jgi:hypothetical protein
LDPVSPITRDRGKKIVAAPFIHNHRHIDALM